MNHKIECGDCLDMMKTTPDKSADMILCDLPYGTTEYKWDTVIPLTELWVSYKRIIKETGAIVLTACQPFTSVLSNSCLELFKYEWIWCKNKTTGYMNAKNAPLKQHENILVFSKSKATINQFSIGRMEYNPQGLNVSMKPKKGKQKESASHHGRGTINKDYIQSHTNYLGTLLYVDSDKKTVHPTQKSVALFEYLIKTYTNEGDTVLDNCLGSGTTSVACERTERNSIGIEISKEYCEIAYNRLREEIRQGKIDKESSIIEKIGF